MSCESTWMVYEINKYPPKVFRRPFGDQTWISYSDIRGGLLTKDEYLLVEDRYVRAVLALCAEFQPVVAHGFEYWNLEDETLTQLGLDDVLSLTTAPTDGQLLDGALLENAIRRCLRENAWLEIVSVGNLIVHFGYDLRVLVAMRRDLAEVFQAIKNDGLFVYDSRADLNTLAEWA